MKNNSIRTSDDETFRIKNNKKEKRENDMKMTRNKNITTNN
ncbi:hypothetical protein [Plasmodium yoelii yoelii]|uniref:Uncharacterized protein n=1 Tax=Plasmodium yoelii yoelii TaxID=73239 RepID=Q7RNJ1_PLAYO|nr:hypothetical protein [Plasmodium yoelii yoelii]